jgi:hypothetical protein
MINWKKKIEDMNFLKVLMPEGLVASKIKKSLEKINIVIYCICDN